MKRSVCGFLFAAACALTTLTFGAAANAQAAIDAASTADALELHRERLAIALATRREARGALEALRLKLKGAPPTPPAPTPPAPTPPAPTPPAPTPPAPTPPPAATTATDSAAALVASELALARVNLEISARETSIAVLNGGMPTADQLKVALEYHREEQRQELLQRQAAVEAKNAGAAAEAQETTSVTQLRVLKTTIDALERASQSDVPEPPPKSKAAEEIREFARGGRVKYGPTISILRFNTQRPNDEPARQRNYEPRFEAVPAEFGFQFIYQPPGNPWRQRLREGKPFQLLSAGGMLLARIDKNNVSRGSLSLAATMSFFEDIVGLGIGVDLYRGIATLGRGKAGEDTAFTGLLAWSFARDGEVTPENVFVVVTLGLEPVVSKITGAIK